MPIYCFWCTSCLCEFTVICSYEDKDKQQCKRCQGWSVIEKMTAGVCINRKKGKIDK